MVTSVDKTLNLNKAFVIKGHVQHYAWGKPASRSLVATLSNMVTCNKPCAELWIGSHPNGPAAIKNASNFAFLNELLNAQGDELLGPKLIERYGKTLPFLFKILSINESLSIQVHPDKASAKKLHLKDSHNYPDANLKAEIAYALSEVELLWGFKEFADIKNLLNNFKSYRSILEPSKSAPQETGQKLKDACEAILNTEMKVIEELTPQLLLEAQAAKLSCSSLLSMLYKKYKKGDMGLFLVPLMQLITLRPGEAIYTPPGVLHAYLSGDLAECMTNSDNTIRAGLSTKFIDVESLLASTDFNFRPHNKLTHLPDINCRQIDRLNIPVDDFFVDLITTELCNSSYQLNQEMLIVFALNAGMKIKIIEEVFKLNPGEALFIPAGHESCEISTSGDGFILGVPN